MAADYPYSQGDLLASPNTYMYSSYCGEAFFDAYASDRMKFLEVPNENIKKHVPALSKLVSADVLSVFFLLDDWKPGEKEDLAEVRARLSSCVDDDLETDTVLRAMLVLMAQGDSDSAEDVERCLAAFAKQFELRKKVFTRYHRGVAKGFGAADHFVLYALLGVALGVSEYPFCDRKQLDFSRLNVLLKVNDFLSASFESLTDDLELPLSLLSVRIELHLIAKLRTLPDRLGTAFKAACGVPL